MVFDNPEEKKQIEHLQRLFALGVEWPQLEPLIRRLIRAPHNAVVDNLYWYIHKLFKGWMIKQRIHPVRMSISDLVTAARQMMSIRS